MTTEPLIQRPYSDEDVERLRGSVTVEHTLARRGALRLRSLLEQEDCVSALGRHDRRPGRSDGQGGPEGDLSLRLAGRGRRQPGRPDLPRSEPLPGDQRAGPGQADQQRAAARRPDRPRRGRRLDRLVCADRRRRRGRLRWTAERIRADEGLHRGGCRRRPLRGPALVGEEVRAPRRQGARAKFAVRANARRSPPCGRRA